MYKKGIDDKHPILDCALVQLASQSQNLAASGLWQGVDKSFLIVKGIKSGMIVNKLGMSTGLIYGCVLDLSLDMHQSYDNYVFFVELSDSNGWPMSGKFVDAGDSGALVVDKYGYVLGMIIQAVPLEHGKVKLGLVSRIGQIQVALNVKVHTD